MPNPSTDRASNEGFARWVYGESTEGVLAPTQLQGLGSTNDPAWYDLFGKLEQACVDLDAAWQNHLSIMQAAYDAGRGDEWQRINSEFQARRDELVSWVDKINAVLKYVPGVEYLSANGLAALPAIIAGVTLAQAVLLIGGVIAASFALQTTAETFYSLVTGKEPPGSNRIEKLVKFGIIAACIAAVVPSITKG